jgi:hypothetical protein
MGFHRARIRKLRRNPGRVVGSDPGPRFLEKIVATSIGGPLTVKLDKTQVNIIRLLSGG